MVGGRFICLIINEGKLMRIMISILGKWFAKHVFNSAKSKR